MKSSVYTKYFSAIGFLSAAMMLTLALARRALEVMSLFWLSHWSLSMENTDQLLPSNLSSQQQFSTVHPGYNFTFPDVNSTTSPYGQDQTYWLVGYATLGIIQSKF